MWPYSLPPHKGDPHIDLGVWHPSTLPADKQNKEGYELLKQRLEEDWPCEADKPGSTEALKEVQGFHDELVKIIDALPDDEADARPWAVVLGCSPEFHLISLWPTVAVRLLPMIVDSARRHGLICFDPQNGVLSIP